MQSGCDLLKLGRIAHSGRLCILSADQPQIATALPNADDHSLVALRTAPAGWVTGNSPENKRVTRLFSGTTDSAPQSFGRK